LVEFHASLEARNDDNDTPMMLAVRAEHPAIVDFLCSKGSDLHTMGYDKIDPISYAMNKRNLYMSDVLIKHESRKNFSSTSSLSESFTHSPLAPSHSDSVFQEE
jgi:ankyrin repeat protein